MLVYDDDKLERALERYIEDGPAGTAKQRREESEGARMVLKSKAFEKLMVHDNPGARGLSADTPAQPLPPRET